MNKQTREVTAHLAPEAPEGFIPRKARNLADWKMLRDALPNFDPKARPRIIRWFSRLANPSWVRGPFVINRAAERRSGGERKAENPRVWRPARTSKRFAKWMTPGSPAEAP